MKRERNGRRDKATVKESVSVRTSSFYDSNSPWYIFRMYVESYIRAQYFHQIVPSISAASENSVRTTASTHSSP
jgi:hypothetical protein